MDSDCLIASVDAKAVKKLFDRSEAEKHSTLAKWIEGCLPDGSLAEWLKTPLQDWNEGQVEALICCRIMTEEETW